MSEEAGEKKGHDKKEGHREEAAKHPTAATDNPISRGSEKLGGGIWALIKGTYTRVKGVLGATIDATIKQPVLEAEEAGKRMGYESKEVGLFNMVAGIIETVNGKASKLLRWPVDVAAGTLDYGTGIPGRVAGRGLRAVQKAWNVIWGIESSAAPAGGHGEEAHGHDAAHTPAH